MEFDRDEQEDDEEKEDDDKKAEHKGPLVSDLLFDNLVVQK